MKNLITLILCFVSIFAFSQEITKSKVTPAQIDAVFTDWNTPNKPGIAVGILNDGEMVYTQGYGLANLEHQISISPQTKFNIGIIAQEFTVYALLLLEHRGKLSLQDDVRKHLPKLNAYPNPIRIQHLIHHTGGLNNLATVKILSGWKPQDILTKAQAYEMIHNQARSIPNSGSVQSMSDAGFMILEDLVAAVSKMSYADFVTKEFFEPLGMTNTLFDTRAAVISNKAAGYFPEADGFVRSTSNHAHTLTSDVYSTVGDMCLWAKELFDPKIGVSQMVKKFDAITIVNNKAVEEVNTAKYTGGHNYWNYRGTKKWSHIAVAGGYACKLIRYPDYDLSVVIMGNDGVYNGYAGTQASALYIQNFLEPVSNESAKIISKKLSPKQLAAFEGDYWDKENFLSRKIQISNDTLRYFRSPGNESALVPLTENSFKMMAWGDVIVDFNPSADPPKMSLTQSNNTFDFYAYDSNANWTKHLDVFTGNYYSKALNTTYAVEVNQGKLVIKHPRFEHIELAPRLLDLFTGNRSPFSSIAFQRDSNRTVSGFRLTTEGVSNIWFEKETVLGSKMGDN